MIYVSSQIHKWSSFVLRIGCYDVCFHTNTKVVIKQPYSSCMQGASYPQLHEVKKEHVAQRTSKSRTGISSPRMLVASAKTTQGTQG